jgi:hypothetical protein
MASLLAPGLLARSLLAASLAAPLPVATSLLAPSLLTACSSGPASHPQHPPRPTGDPPPPQSAPTERECDELITHAVALGIDERAARPERTTQADHEAVRRSLREDFVTG